MSPGRRKPASRTPAEPVPGLSRGSLPPEPAAALAGAHASSSPSSPIRRLLRRVRGGRVPARRSASPWRRLALLPALALLLGALGLFAAAPAQAQNTVTLWSAMLDVQNYDYTRAHFGHIVGRGCTEPRFVSTTYRCRGALTDDSFSYGGQTYRVAVLQSTSYLFSGTRRNQIDIALDRNIPAAFAQRATLVVGSTRWSLADGAVGGFSVYRNGVEDASPSENGYSWLGSLPASGRVRVSLEMPAPSVPYVDPGAGRNTVWSSTLTADEDGVFLGCDRTATQENCSVALTDDDFVYEGLTYRVQALYYASNTKRIFLRTTPAAQSRLAGLELHLGGTRLTVGSAPAGTFRWDNVNAQWSDGQQVGLRLTAPDPSPALSASGPALSASGAPREGAAPVTVTVTLPEPALDGGVNVTVNLGGTATWGEDYRTPVPAGPEYDDYRRPVRNEGKGWFGRTSSETVQAANLLHIPSGSRSASFEIHVVDDPHEDSGETIDIGVRADHAGIQYTGGQVENCPTCSRRTSLLTYMGAAELTLRITNHEDAETEAARLAAEAAAEAEKQRLAAARAAAGGPLSGLALSAGSQAVALVPAFSPNVLSYRAEVPAGTAGVSLAPSWGAEAALGGSPSVVLLSSGGATILAQTQVHASGTAAALALSPSGPTGLEVTVIEPDGSGKPRQGTTTTYRIEVAGAAAPQTAAAGGPLSGLALTAGSEAVALVPAFSPGVTSYRAEVPAGTREVSLEPSWGAAAAPTVWARSRRPAPHLTLLSRQRVHGSGTAAALPLSPDGPTRLEVTVLQPGLTTTDYRIEVTEAQVQAQVPEEQTPPEEEAQTVTVAFGKVPAEHDGRTAFALDVQSGSKPAPEAFTVTAGTVTGVEPLDPVLWRVRVAPSSWKDVKIALGEASAKVRGPARIRVADARAKEGKDASLDFAVTLSRAASHEVSVDYATKDGTAAAGADYTAASGTLTFAPGETAKTVSVALLDDSHDEGKETFSLTLSNPQGAYLRKMHREAKGVIRNDDPLQAMWLSRFGRTAAENVVEAVGARIGGGAAAGVVLGGHSLTGGKAEREAIESRLAEALLKERDARLGRGEEMPAPSVREVSMSDLLLASSFHMASAENMDAGSRWSLWGRGARSSFEGAGGGLSLEGDVTTATVGFDYERSRWLVGVALSRSSGDGSYKMGGACDTGCAGEVESTLTGVWPYARYRVSGSFSLWGVVGLGSGGMTLTPGGAESMDADLDMGVAAGGARGVLLPARAPGGFELALRADVLVTDTRSDAAAGLAETEAGTSRVRLALEGSRSYKMGDAVLTPSVEIGFRNDSGDAETGGGVEAGGGLRWSSGALTAEVRARGLISHNEGGYEEWGVSASVGYAPGSDGRGLTLRAGSSWGAAAGGAERLWSRAGGSFAGGAFDPVAGFDAEAGWGLDAWGGLLTPYTGFTLTGSGETYRAGGRFRLAESLTMSLEGDLRERDGGASVHGVALRGSMRW